MRTNFIIHHGDLIINDDCIIINDKNIRWLRIFNLAGSVAVILLGVFYILKYPPTQSKWLLWMGLIMIIGGTVALIIHARSNYRKSLLYRDIKKVNIRYNYASQYLAEFILNDGTKRTVILDQYDLARFDKFHLKDFMSALEGRKIKVEVQS